MAKSLVRTLASLMLLSLVAAACGQKEGVRVGFDNTGASGGGAVAGPGDAGDAGFSDDGFTDDGGDAGDVSGDAGSGDTGSGDAGGGDSGTGGSSTGGGDSGGGTGSGGTTGGNSGGAPAPVGRGDTTGITDTTIKIGLHAPLSGAAPLPQASFVEGRDQYWRHVGKVFGRTVEVVVRDDQYNPSRATSVCNDLIQREKVMMLIGGGGTDQISACARTAQRQGVPYLSAGVDEGLLRNLPNYFALSMSYIQQSPLLIQWVKKNSPPPNNKFGILRDRTPGFNNVVAEVKKLAEAQGWEVLVRQTQNGPSDASWLTQNQIKVAFPIMAPSTFIQIVRSPGGSIDQWAGLGITMGLNTVAQAACQGNPAYGGSMFFSPSPGLNVVPQLDPEFAKAGGEDDIHLLLWGVNKSIHEVFKKMSASDLSREGFQRAFESNVIESKVFPVLKHRPGNHFGAQDVHVLLADCTKAQYVTPPDGLHRSSF